MLGLALLDGTLALTGRGLTREAVAALLEPQDLLREGDARRLGPGAAARRGRIA